MHFHSRKCIWKCCLPNGSPSISASFVLIDQPYGWVSRRPGHFQSIKWLYFRDINTKCNANQPQISVHQRWIQFKRIHDGANLLPNVAHPPVRLHLLDSPIETSLEFFLQYIDKCLQNLMAVWAVKSPIGYLESNVVHHGSPDRRLDMHWRAPANRLDCFHWNFL